MRQEFFDAVETLEMVLGEELPVRLKSELERLYSSLKGSKSVTDAIKVRDDLEEFLVKVESYDFVAVQIRDVISLIDALN